MITRTFINDYGWFRTKAEDVSLCKEGVMIVVGLPLLDLPQRITIHAQAEPREGWIPVTTHKAGGGLMSMRLVVNDTMFHVHTRLRDFLANYHLVTEGPEENTFYIKIDGGQ